MGPPFLWFVGALIFLVRFELGREDGRVPRWRGPPLFNRDDPSYWVERDKDPKAYRFRQRLNLVLFVVCLAVAFLNLL